MICEIFHSKKVKISNRNMVNRINHGQNLGESGLHEKQAIKGYKLPYKSQREGHAKKRCE